jgi:putative ABC transport system permease protein
MNLATLSSIAIGFETLRANPLRTTLSTLGIVIGAASLVAVLALGDGIERFGRQQIEQTTDLQSVVVQSRTTLMVDGRTYPIDNYPVFTAAIAESLLGAIPQAKGAAITLTGESPIGGPAVDSTSVLVAATLPNGAALFDMHFAAGRYFTAEEAGDNAPVIVLSHGLAGRLMGGPAELALQQTVRLRGRGRTVIGVLAAMDGEKAGVVYVPIQGKEDAFVPTPSPRAPDLVLQARGVEDVPAVVRGAENWLAVQYGDWRRLARVSSNLTRVAQASQAMWVFKMFMGAITGISLLVGGIGIMNVLLAAVTERTREIGIRKAIGARRIDVQLQFLAESVAISGLGSALGAGLGLGGAFGITAVIRAKSAAQVYAAFTWGTLTVSALAALLVGVVFGMYPAIRASRLSPIDAIRHE